MSKMDKDRLYRRLEALLELSKSEVNEAEAFAAAMKAQELIKEYNLSLEELDDYSKQLEEEIIEEILEVSRVGWNRSLCTTVAKNCQCYAFICGNGRRMKIFGHKCDVEVAVSIYKFLYNVAETLYAKYYNSMYAQGIRPHKFSYMTGFVRGVRSKLEENCTALQLVVPEDVTSEYKGRYPHMATCTSQSTQYSASDYSTGFDDGKSAVNSRHLRGQKQLAG